MSQLVNESVSDKHNQWSDSGPIIIVTVKVKEQDMAESFLHVVWRFPNQSKPAGIEVDVDKLANGCFWVY